MRKSPRFMDILVHAQKRICLGADRFIAGVQIFRGLLEMKYFIKYTYREVISLPKLRCLERENNKKLARLIFIFLPKNSRCLSCLTAACTGSLHDSTVTVKVIEKLQYIIVIYIIIQHIMAL